MMGLLSILLVGLQLSASLATAPTIEAKVTIHPKVLNLKRNGTGVHGVFSVFISNLENDSVSYDVREINVSTIMLYHETTFVASANRTMVAKGKLIVKFDAATVANYIWFKLWHIIPLLAPPPDYTMTFTVEGELLNGEEFAGRGTIMIIFP